MMSSWFTKTAISVTKGGTHTFKTSVKNSVFSIFNNIIMVVIHAIKIKGNVNLNPIFLL